MFSVTLVERNIFLQGHLVEDVQFEELKKACLHEGIAQDGGMGQVSIGLDLSGITHANSAGLMALSNFFRSEKNSLPAIRFVKTPEFLMEILSMAPDLIRPCDWIESVQVPLFNKEKGQRLFVTLTVGDQIPLLADYSGFDLDMELDGEIFVFDSDVDMFFRALAQMVRLRQGSQAC